MAGIDDVQTLVVVMLENRSFDNVLGHLSHPDFGARDDVRGLVDPSTTIDYDNFYENQVYKPFVATDGKFTHDLPHVRETIAEQLDIVNGQPTMGGFVRSYVNKTHSVVKKPPPMGFLRPRDVPISRFLAEEYLVCDRWFSPIPTGTQPNRAVAFTGSSLIENNVIQIPYRDMVFDWMDARNVRWRVYHSGLSFFLLFGLFDRVFEDDFRSIRRLAQDLSPDPVPGDPEVIFIEPEYEDSPVHLGFTPNDNHPPLPMAPGEALLHQIYTALTLNPKRWARTLLVVTYDEHGGFFDHEIPPPIVMQPPPGADYERAFEFTGVRVPTLIASPLVDRHSVCGLTMDHTSVLQFLAEKYADGPDTYAAEVTRRREQGIASLSAVLSDARPREDVPPPPNAPITMRSVVRPGVKQQLSENQVAFAAAARAGLRADPVAAVEKYPELAMLPPEDVAPA